MTTSIHRVTNAATGVVTITDDRTVDACRAEQLARVRAACGTTINSAAPDYKQRNAALGLLSPEETAAIVATVQAHRTACAALEAAIEGVTWDGNEASRAAACDAIQAVTWQS